MKTENRVSELYSTLLIDLSLASSPSRAARIATLGPAGTSSETAATRLAEYLAQRGFAETGVVLHDQYEAAADALRADAASLLVVANAYANVSEFYMDTALRLVGAFVLDTPLYGIAATSDSPTSGPVRVASHPAPVPLIEELIDHERYQVVHVERFPSTSAAAAAVGRGVVDLALTTEPARARHGLRFVSSARPIRMLWSVFGHRRDH